MSSMKRAGAGLEYASGGVGPGGGGASLKRSKMLEKERRRQEKAEEEEMAEMAENEADMKAQIESASTTNTSTNPLSSSSASGSTSQPKNAFTELLSSAKKPTTTTTTKPSSSTSGQTPTWRTSLKTYLHLPPTSPQILHSTETYILIPDLFPKSTIHLLLLLRDPSHNTTPPLTLFSPPTPSHTTHLAHALTAGTFARTLVAKEMKRRLGGSVSRWEREIKVGVHAVPSMENLHIHVLTRDMVSERVKGRKHYNAFNTGFFVGLEEFPIEEEGVRKRRRKGLGHAGGLVDGDGKAVDGTNRAAKDAGDEDVTWTERDLRCWRCGRNFGNKWTKLRDHLVEEKERWVADVVREGKIEEEEREKKEREEEAKSEKVKEEDDGDATEPEE